jgi:hypothetical protein
MHLRIWYLQEDSNFVYFKLHRRKKEYQEHYLVLKKHRDPHASNSNRNFVVFLRPPTQMPSQYLTPGKDTVFQLQAWAGPWGPGSLRLPDFLDFRNYEGGKVVTLTHRPSLPPGVFLPLTVRSWVYPKAHGSVGTFGKISQRHHWESIPRPSD